MKKILFILILFSILLYGCAQNNVGISPTTANEPKDAGDASRYLAFEKTHYENSISEGKVILLDFYANWCPICRAENPSIRNGLKELNNPNVVAYQVHFNDGETTQEHEDLAKQFGVNLQHTKVILKNGEFFSKSLESWSKDKTIDEISKAL